MNRPALINAGIDYDEGVERFGGKEQTYAKFLKRFFSNTLMDEMERLLEAGDLPGAFRVAHDLKGAAGNLSLNHFYAVICQLTEVLRGGGTEYAELLSRARKLYDAAKRAAEEE